MPRWSFFDVPFQAVFLPLSALSPTTRLIRVRVARYLVPEVPGRRDLARSLLLVHMQISNPGKILALRVVYDGSRLDLHT